jgi:chaperonin GroEL
MAKDLKYSKEARNSLLLGAEKLAKTVGVTMGPQGKNVILGKFVGAPVITKDGVSVAREVTLEDPVEDLACQLIKEAAGRTAAVAGDGTTTATVLTHEIFKLGNELISSGYSPLLFKSGLNWAVSKVSENLEELASPVSGYNTLRDIATISANNDSVLGEKIAEAFDVVGSEGTVAAEAAPGADTSVRFVDGVELDSGYISQGFVVNPGQTDITLSKPRILIYDGELSSITPCLALFNKASDENIQILIIAKDVRQEALATLVANNKIGRLNCVAVKMPVMGAAGLDAEKEWLDCLAALCGANIAGKDRGLPLSQATFDDLGAADRVSVNRFTTKIIEGNKDKVRISDKLSIYEKDAKKLLGDKQLLDTRKRVAFLKSKAAMITVGYSTELELREKGDRVDDAVCATRAALEEGVLPGGGAALLRAASMVSLDEADEAIRPAAAVLLEACKRPIRQILENGYEDPEPIIQTVLSNDDHEFGYNAATSSFEKLIEGGVVDPKKVTRTALQNAASISLLLINTEAIVSEQAGNPSSWQPPSGWRPPEEGTLRHKY